MESAGSFTLDFTKAVEKLRIYQTANPHSYINRMLRSAARAGATRCALALGLKSTRIFLDACPCYPEELQRLFEQIFLDDRPAASEFSTAINIALGLKPSTIEVQVARKGSSSLLVLGMEGDQPEVKAYSTQAEFLDGRWTSVQLTWSMKDTLNRALGETPELYEVLRRFHFSPVRIEVNRKPIGRARGWDVPAHAGWILTSADAVHFAKHFFSLAVAVPKLHNLLEVRLGAGEDFYLPPPVARHVVRAPAPFEVALGLCADENQPSQAHFLYLGQILQVYPVEVGLSGLRLLISANDLGLDLSGEKLREDEAFEERWQETRSVCHTVRDFLYNRYGARNWRKKLFFERSMEMTREL